MGSTENKLVIVIILWLLAIGLSLIAYRVEKQFNRIETIETEIQELQKETR